MKRTLLWIGAIIAVTGGSSVLIGLIIGSRHPAPNEGVVEGLYSLYGLPFIVIGAWVLLGGLAVVVFHFVLKLVVYIVTGK